MLALHPPQKQKVPLSERPSIDLIPAVVRAPTANTTTVHTPISLLLRSANQAQARVDDPQLVKELKESALDAVVSEVIRALNDRSLPLKMRDTSATLLKGFRSQDPAARKLAQETATAIAHSDNSDIAVLGQALTSRLDIFVEDFRALAAKNPGAVASSSLSSSSGAALMADADANLYAALSNLSADISARHIKFAATDTDQSAFALDPAVLQRHVAGVLHGPVDAAKRSAGNALCTVVSAYRTNDPNKVVKPQLEEWARTVCTAAVDGLSDVGADNGSAREYLVAFFVRAMGSAFVFRDCGLSSVLNHCREHFNTPGFPTHTITSLLGLLPDIGGRCTIPFLTNPERFLALDILIDLCGRGETMRAQALASTRSMVRKLHFVDLNETMGYLVNVAMARWVAG